MDAYYIGLLLIIVSGIFQGTYGLGMKKFAPFSWEAFWSVFSIFSMLIIPAIWICAVIPDPIGAISSVSNTDKLITTSMGALWGIGALLWGFGIVQLGMSITYGVAMSVCAISGSAGLLLTRENFWAMDFFPYWLAGSLLMILGVVFITKAGLRREKDEGKKATKPVNKFFFYCALVGVFFSGIFSGLLNIGYSSSVGIANAAITQGASKSDACLLQWTYVFVGGFTVQFIYALVLLFKNKSFSTFFAKGCYKGYIIAIVTALLWYLALALYGKGSTELGEMGNVIGWTMFISLSLIVSNVFAIYSGEWDKKSFAFKLLLIGDVILILACIALGYSNKFSM